MDPSVNLESGIIQKRSDPEQEKFTILGSWYSYSSTGILYA
jgi:hypothetical protein